MCNIITKEMKKKLIICLLFVTNLMVSQTTINTVLEDFSVLKVYNGIDLELVPAKEQRIKIWGEKANKVKIKQANGVVKVTMRFPETTADGKVKATLYFNKEIAVIDANEGAIVTGKGFNQSKITVKSQEGAFVNLVVKVNDLQVKSLSGAVIKLSGETKNQTVTVNLGGVYHGYNVKANNLTTVKAGAGAKAEVTAIEELDAKVTFGGSIFYHTKPKNLKEQKVMGGIIELRN